MDSINEIIAKAQGMDLEETVGKFEGEELPSVFAKTLQEMKFRTDEDSDSEEEKSPPQKTLAELKREEDLKRRTMEEQVRTVEDIAPAQEKEEWGEQHIESSEDAELRARIKKEIPDLLNNEIISAAEKVSEMILLGSESNFSDLIESLSHHGLTLSERESHALERKFKAMNGLSVRESILFTEGLRTANTISEAKIAGHLESFGKVLDQYRSQIRLLERSINESKIQEKIHMDRMAKIESEKQETIARVEHRCKTYFAEQKEAVKRWKEAEEKKAIEEIQTYKSLYKKKGKTEKASTSVVAETPKKDPEIDWRYESADYEGQEDADSVSAGACSALLIIADGNNFTVGDFAKYYKLDVDLMNECLMKFPQTKEAILAEFGNIDRAYTAADIKLSAMTAKLGLKKGW